jgi:hypothetical protein
MSKYNHRMVVIYYGLKTKTCIIPPLKWPPSRFGRTMHCGWQWLFKGGQTAKHLSFWEWHNIVPRVFPLVEVMERVWERDWEWQIKMGMRKPYTIIKTELNKFTKSHGATFDWKCVQKVQEHCILPFHGVSFGVVWSPKR